MKRMASSLISWESGVLHIQLRLLNIEESNELGAVPCKDPKSTLVPFSKLWSHRSLQFKSLDPEATANFRGEAAGGLCMW